MALQGPFVVVADGQAIDVVEALRAAGAFPVVETGWAEAPQALASVDPEAVVLAEPCGDGGCATALERAFAERRKARGAVFMPIVARTREESAIAVADALAIAASAPAERIVRRLAAALRIRALHATVLRRTATLTSRGELCPQLPSTDPLDDATVLVAGRGRSYPALSVAIGERVGLAGAFSVESAARALNARDIDGMVIGDGFAPRIVEALLTVLAEDVRFRDLPVAVLGGPPGVIEPFCTMLPNLERTAEGPARLAERFMPFVRLHAFGQRLRRMLKSLDAEGMIDPETGLLAQAAFWRDLNRAVDDAEKRGVGLSIARFSFEHADQRFGRDAARLLSRLMRQVDFACREADNSIFAVFTETDLRAAHVIARRIAGVLKNTMLAPDRERGGLDTAVTLATLKPTDSVDSLIARVVAARLGPHTTSIPHMLPAFQRRKRCARLYRSNERPTAMSDANQAAAVHIDVLSDVVCPWCYIGKRRLEQALELTPEVAVSINWRPYFLNTWIPREGIDRQTYLETKFGSADRYTVIAERVAAAAAIEGLRYAPEKISRQPNTLDCHRLILWSRGATDPARMKQRLMELYFAEGADLSDPKVLIDAAVECGMDGDLVRRLLGSDADTDRVEGEANSAKEAGIDGVPCFIFGGSVIVTGAQSPEYLASAIERTAGRHTRLRA